jgi:hypothetical protein
MTAESLLSGYEDRIPAIAQSLREFIFAQLQGIRELADGVSRIISYNEVPGYKNLLSEARAARRRRINQS